jgi:hypothetical protein
MRRARGCADIDVGDDDHYFLVSQLAPSDCHSLLETDSRIQLECVSLQYSNIPL